MDRRRARGLPAAVIVSLVVLTASASVAPREVAAAPCSLAAPATVSVGSTVVIVGSAFPTNTTVDMSVTLDGGTPEQFTVGSDQDGAFRVTLTAELGDVGRNTVDARVDSICSARAVFTVIGPATASPTTTATARPSGTPRPTASPERTATTQPAASAAGSPAPTPPRSDIAPSLAPESAPPGLTLGLVIMLLGGLSLVGSALARRARN